MRREHDNRENNEVVEFRVAHQYYEIHVVAEICILRSLDCLQPRGMIVTFGQTSGAIDQRFALKDSADAQKALEARATSGSTILTL